VFGYLNKVNVIINNSVRLAETWLKLAKNTVLAELLREKNTVLVKKKSQTN